MRRWFGLVTIIVAFLILPAGHILPAQSQGGNPDISITCSPTALEYGVLPLNSTSEYSNTMITYCDLSNPTSYNESVNIQITAAGLEYRAPDSVFVGPYSTVTFELEIYGNISDDEMSRQLELWSRLRMRIHIENESRRVKPTLGEELKDIELGLIEFVRFSERLRSGDQEQNGKSSILDYTKMGSA